MSSSHTPSVGGGGVARVGKEDTDDDQRVSLPPPRHHSEPTIDEADDEEAPHDWRHEGGEAKLEENIEEDPLVFSARSGNNQSSIPSLAECSTQQLPKVDMDAAEEKRQVHIQATRGSVDNKGNPRLGEQRNQQGKYVSGTASFVDVETPRAIVVEDMVTAVDAVVVMEEKPTETTVSADDIAREVIRQLQAAKDPMNDLTSIQSDTTATQPHYAANKGINSVINNNVDAEAQKRRKLMRWIGGCSVVAVVVAVIVVVIVLVTRPSPTPIVKPTVPNISMCGDFPCSSDSTVVELVDGASNHTLLAEYLKRDYNSGILKYLSNSNNVTLFAPTDDSFRALSSPYSYYISGNDNWRVHLWLLLATNILDQAVNASQMFKEAALQTWLTNFALSVNQTSSTIENGASIVISDIKASNGYIQVPDPVVIVSDLRTSVYDSVVPENFEFASSLTKFRELLQASGLEDTLKQNLENGLTVFIPNDDAFGLLDANVTAMLFEIANKTFIKNFVLYHMVNANVDSLDPLDEYTYQMFNSVSAWFTNNNPDNNTMINSATVLVTYYASNGFLSIIDRVLLPPNLGELLQITTNVTSDFNTSTFYEIVNDHANLGSLFNGVAEGRLKFNNRYTSNNLLTVFAPVESAFTAMADPSSLINRLLDPVWLLHLQNLCLHHFTTEAFDDGSGRRLSMLSGFDVTFNVLAQGTLAADANETVDGVHVEVVPGMLYPIVAPSEGVIRFIDQVLLPPWVSQSLNNTIFGKSTISYFSLKVQQSNLQVRLNGTADTPLTVLAPNNDAFGTSNNTLTPQELVLRHTFRGNLYEASLNQTVVSLSNETFQVQRNGSNTYIGRALIVQPDVLAANGVIHVIDRFL